MKAIHKIWRPALAVTAIAGLIGTVAVASRPFPSSVKKNADGPAPSTSAVMPGLNYSTGFEPGEGFTLGYIGQNVKPTGCGGTPASPCWGRTTAANASLVEGHIDSVHPASGTQHLRLSHDPATRTNQPGFGLGVDARYPSTASLSVRPIAPNTVTCDVAIDTPFGQDFRIQPQSNSQGFLATSALFYFYGGIYILDNQCGNIALSFVPTGVGWDSSGAYQQYRVVMNPCIGQITYYYGGAQIYQSCTYAGTNLEQFLVFGDNFPGSSMDIDNVVLQSEEECVAVCGNGIIEFPEQCEVGNDSNCPGRCNAQTCECARICTLADPCILHNGANGPFVPPCDAQYGCIFLYDGTGVPSVSIDTCGSNWDTKITFWGSANDLSDNGTSNDDCCDPAIPACGANFGAGSDPSASCYNNIPNFESCTCHSLPGYPADTLWIGQLLTSSNGLPPAGATTLINIDKKASCGGARLGSCCDTNGAGAGTCEDGLTEAQCQGPDKVWTENGKCATVECVCIPNCAGRQCGDDGCGGSCGSCDDGNACNGVETCNPNGQCVPGTPVVCDDGNVCNGTETCNPANGQCVPGTPLVCDDGNACNGVETCNPASGCVAGTPLNCNDGNVCNGTETCNPATGCVPGSPLICDDGQFCNGAEGCDPQAGCTPGTPPCDEGEVCDEEADACIPTAIPTVSEWGLVILALLLLTGAKVYFGRRQAIA